MYDFFKIRQKNKVLTSQCTPPNKSGLTKEQQLWVNYPVSSPASIGQIPACTLDKFWQDYEALLAQAQKKHRSHVIQKASDPTGQSSQLSQKLVFRSQRTPFNFIGLLTDLVVAVLVAPSQEATLFFCLVVSVLYLTLALFSFTSLKYVIFLPKSLMIRNYRNNPKHHFLFSEIQSMSFYSRKEDSDKLYIETSDMEFCVDVNIKPEKIRQLFYSLRQKGITINL